MENIKFSEGMFNNNGQFDDVVIVKDENGIVSALSVEQYIMTNEGQYKVMSFFTGAEILNNVIVSMFGENSMTGWGRKRFSKDGKLTLTVGEYDLVLKMFMLLRNRTNSSARRIAELGNNVLIRKTSYK